MSEDAVKKRLSRARTALRGMVVDALGDTLQRTAPGSAFTVAVVAALPLTMPLSASAAVVTAKMTPATASTRALARDDRERRELRWMAAAQIAGALVFVITVQVSLFREGVRLPIVGYALFSAILTGSSLWWQPRISARPLAAEVLEDPVHAPTRHRRDRRKVILWNVAGLALGWSALFIVLRFIAHKL